MHQRILLTSDKIVMSTKVKLETIRDDNLLLQLRSRLTIMSTRLESRCIVVDCRVEMCCEM